MNEKGGRESIDHVSPIRCKMFENSSYFIQSTTKTNDIYFRMNKITKQK